MRGDYYADGDGKFKLKLSWIIKGVGYSKEFEMRGLPQKQPLYVNLVKGEYREGLIRENKINLEDLSETLANKWIRIPEKGLKEIILEGMERIRDKIFKDLECPECDSEDYEEAWGILVNHIEKVKKEFGVKE